jgi:hypothetical protein
MVPKSFYKLANPRLIHDDVDIEFEIELGTIKGLDRKLSSLCGPRRNSNYSLVDHGEAFSG